MPLIQGYSRRSISRNIRSEVRAGRPRRQAAAIAFSVARAAKRRAGKRRGR